jgi:hypothetical protein
MIAMFIAARIPQVDRITRYLLDADETAAIANQAVIIETGSYDAATPEYAVDRAADGSLTAMIFPGDTMSPEEWAAVRAAIGK